MTRPVPSRVDDPYRSLGIARGARQVVGLTPPPPHQPLVAPAQQLAPQHARTQSVAMPQALPPNIRYGNVPPGIAQSSRFTGGVVQQQPASQILPPPDFIAPTYPGISLHPPAPVSGPTAPLGSRLSSLLAPPAPPGPGPTRTVATGLTYGQQPAPNVITGTPGTPVSSSGGSINSFVPGTTVSSSGQSLSNLLATAAQRGTRIGGSYWQL
jgi:hypothetical protein